MSDVALIRQSAIQFLSRREHSRQELFRKLTAKTFPEDLIEQVLDECVQGNAQSDERFCESFVRYRQTQGQGPIRIQQELQQRGVSGDLIAQYLDAVDEDVWFERASETLSKKTSSGTRLDYKTQAKLMRFLQYRGFTHEQINAAVEAIKR